jgi:HlyD family secretion protein
MIALRGLFKGERNTMRRRAVSGRRRILAGAVLGLLLIACNGDPEPDAYGNFEAVEVVVSAQTTGQVERFVPLEGERLAAGDLVAVIDTTQLALERDQLVAQRAATASRRREVSEQLRVLEVQRDVSQRNLERTRRLHEQRAATAQQLDQAEREYRVLVAQMGALQAQGKSVELEESSGDARVRQLEERIVRSSVMNPRTGTVLATYAREGEVVQAGQPLYRVANLDTLELRVYVTGAQLGSVFLGQPVTVSITANEGELRSMQGTVSWISSSAEFTPTPVQTRDERADLVYAVKVRVPNEDGVLKIGMPADVVLAPPGTQGSGGAARPGGAASADSNDRGLAPQSSEEP